MGRMMVKVILISLEGNRFGRLDRGGFGNREYDRGGRGFRGADANIPGGSGFGRGQYFGRDQDRVPRGGADDAGKGAAYFRGGVDQRYQGTAGN